MVGGSIDRRDLVDTSRQTGGDISSEDAVHGGCVQALEEGEFTWVGWCRLGERLELFNDDVGVALDLALRVQLLGCREVVLLSVHKVSSLETSDGNGDGEWLVGIEFAIVGWECELGRRHVIDGWDEAHRCRVARSTSDLLAVGLGQVAGGAEIDEVVARCEGCDLAGRRVRLAVVQETGVDQGRIEREGILEVGVVLGGRRNAVRWWWSLQINQINILIRRRSQSGSLTGALLLLLPPAPALLLLPPAPALLLLPPAPALLLPPAPALLLPPAPGLLLLPPALLVLMAPAPALAFPRRAAMSAAVEQAIDVPGELTNGRAEHLWHFFFSTRLVSKFRSADGKDSHCA